MFQKTKENKTLATDKQVEKWQPQQQIQKTLSL